MNKRMIAMLLAVSLSGAAFAASANSIERIASETGLREREVRMLAGAPSAFAEYRTSYRNLQRKAAAKGLDLRSTTVIERHARELDRAVAFSMKVDARQLRAQRVAAL